MENIYKYSKIATTEDYYGVRNDTVSQNNLLNYGLQVMEYLSQ